MYRERVVNAGITLPACVSVSRGDFAGGAFIGFQPFTHSPAQSKTTYPSTLIQGNQDILGENSCLHDSRHGDITLLPKDLFYHEDGGDFPPVLMIRTGGTRDTQIGNYLVGLGGDTTTVLKDKRGNVYYAARVAHIGYTTLFLYVSFRTNSKGEPFFIIHGDHYWYDENYQRYTYKNPYQAERPGTYADGIKFMRGVSNDMFGSQGKPNPSPGRRSYGVNAFASTQKIQHVRFSSSLRYTEGPSRLRMPPHSMSKIDFGVLTQKAVASLDGLNINSISFVSEAINFKSLLPPMKDLKGFRNPKSWANIYLWLRYGLSLSYKDTKTILKSIPKLLRTVEKYKDKHERVRHSAVETISYKQREWTHRKSVRIVLDTIPDSCKALGRAISGIRKLGLYPSLENLWDLVPYTFVIDWIVPVGESLSRIDTNIRLQEYNIHAVTSTDVYETKYPATDSYPSYLSSGEVTDRYYNRSVSSALPSKGMYDTTPEVGKANFQRILDGASLIIQRL